jgi:hypothetical protein
MADTLNSRMKSDRDDEEEDPLPKSLLVFTSPALDRDEATAREVADKIGSVHNRLVDGMYDLENMERALAQAEPVSTRAREARAEIRRAIAGLDEVIGGTSEAHDALIFHWKPGTRSPVTDALYG